MSTLSVTCCIPVRNGASTIERAVKSAIDAGCDKVLVYDDASTDNTIEVALRMDVDARIEVRGAWPLTTHYGVNYARNFLIECAFNNSLIIPLDADDTLCDIAPLRDAWQPNTWVYGNHIEVQDGNETLVKGAPAGSLPRKNITGVTFLFHKDDWQKLGGYDPDFAYAEDYAFQCALTNAGVKPVYVDTAVYFRYMRHEGNERSVLANEYWTFYRTMARRKYPNVFSGT